MINVAAIRAAAAATDGDIVALGKDQLEQLLEEVLVGQAARRQLHLSTAIGAMLPIDSQGSSAQ